MIFISHRGNIEGKKVDEENKPEFILQAIELGYDVEIDLWIKNNILFLGHDEPLYEIELNWLLENKDRLWVHAKNLDCLTYLSTNKIDLNYFWHDADLATLTSKNFIWAKENTQLIDNSVAMIPDFYDINYYNCIGVCSDRIKLFKEKYEKTRH